ncbi:hypothetical protein C8T65DRAFT_745629 [Cerioporus squamosus]|nr:hypothetical protein C8T65DRAFT_745629 [Cerioporus squamosus]
MPLEEGMRVTLVGLAKDTMARDGTPLEQYQPYDPHVIGRVIGIVKRRPGWLKRDDEYDVPVATDDEETLKGSQELEGRGQGRQRHAVDDDDLPPSSPIESWTEEDVEASPGRKAGERELSTTESYDTAAMWSAAGSLSGTFLFDEHEAGPREEGEIDEQETTRTATAGDGDKADVDEEKENSRKRAEKWEDFLSKHQTEHSLLGFTSTWQREPNRDGSNEDNENSPPDASKRHDRWSAVPHTKAWQHREEQRAGERSRIADEKTESREHRRAHEYMDEDAVLGQSTAGEERSWNQPTMRDADLNWQERTSVHHQTDDDLDYRHAERLDVPMEDWTAARTRVGGAVPTIVAREEGVADLPVTVDDPSNDKWTVHFDDPETLLRGQSAGFVKIVWWGVEPTVIFTVYNYKYTENDAINRHIESSVTGITTMLTGETGFHVVPPDPEWQRQVQSRDLPFAWAIRGLSEAGAWEMVKTRIVTSKGVTIITYPRTLANPRWVCGLVGFLRPDTEAIRKTVMGVLRSEYMLGRLASLTRSSTSLTHIPEGRRVDYVLRSLEVRVTATKEGAYVANLYITPPTDDMDAWREWAEELRSCRFNAFLFGQEDSATRVLEAELTIVGLE